MEKQSGHNKAQPKRKYIFNEAYVDEFDAFVKYFNEICVNGYVRTIIEEIEAENDFCELYSGVEKNVDIFNLEFKPMTNEKINKDISYATNVVTIKSDLDKGRSLIATRFIPKNTLIINEIPAVLQVNPICECEGDSETSLYRCHHCGAACNKFFVCDGCNTSIFCSRFCLKEAYRVYHMFECYGLQRHFWILDDLDCSYISLRMVLYGASKGFDTNLKKSYGNENNSYPFIYNLQSHFKDLHIRNVNDILYSAAKNLLYLVRRTKFFNFYKFNRDVTEIQMHIGGLLVKHYCQAQINNVILRYTNNSIRNGLNVPSGFGKAICPTIALINHSCSPNACIVLATHSIVVKSIRDIKKNEEITLCYAEVNAFFLLEERRLITENLLNFCCKCNLCEKEDGLVIVL